MNLCILEPLILYLVMNQSTQSKQLGVQTPGPEGTIPKTGKAASTLRGGDPEPRSSSFSSC